jgi:multiple antibiotic resistance protein
MHNVILFSGTVFMGFFAIMNPIANTPIFLGLTQDMGKKEKHYVAVKSVLFAFIIVAAFCISGHIIFELFGITLPAFQIGGGILLFFVGFDLLHGRKSKMHHHPVEKDSEKISEETDKSSIGVAISPLAIPILAGPGTISTALNFVGANTTLVHSTIVIFLFGIMCLITYFFFITGEKLISYIGRSGVKVISGLMGLILTIIAVQMVIVGIHGAISAYK